MHKIKPNYGCFPFQGTSQVKIRVSVLLIFLLRTWITEQQKLIQTKCLFIRIYKVKHTFCSMNNKYYLRYTYDLTRFYPPIFLFHLHIQRKGATNRNQQPTATHGQCNTTNSENVWQPFNTGTQAQRPSYIFKFQFFQHLLLVLPPEPLRNISQRSKHAGALTVCGEVFITLCKMEHFSNIVFLQLDLTTTKCPSFQVHYWTSKINNKNHNRNLGEFSSVRFSLWHLLCTLPEGPLP